MSASLRREGAVAVVEIDNPPLNIIDQETRTDLHRHLSGLALAPDVRCVVLTGSGERAFCAGADLNEEEELTPETVRRFIAEDNQVYDDVEALGVPVVAAVNGHCMGGGFELALACDIRVAAADAKFCAAGVKVGLVVSTTRLVRLVGLAAAKDIVLTGRTFTGDEARELGVVTRTAPRADVRAAALEVAQEIASRAPLAVRRAKSALAEAADLHYEQAMEREIDHFVALQNTWDHKHAIESFFQKRRPSFEGR
ncbi:enoyl-CoA hydratase/isomerase family protein [Nocardiopsis ansamitocini]|uniref:Crotonase n=1 Tax=Nocardiopsis ansamitocini TaxID=1670832 RepID=A0A9W6UIB5_9ACTN|nr:enoyl-CoA hydratase/isomerase family protein [Nocardiopsis ansamitocini]GLU49771.1 crotonase [Nocardiopsis ansamitocini]